jgi:hypothetical protein
MPRGGRAARLLAPNDPPGSTLVKWSCCGPTEIENAAIARVLELEIAAGRTAFDARGRGALADIDGDRLIEVKAYGSSARGADLSLETRQVQAAEADPERFQLVIVENVRQGEPSALRVLDLCGQRLTDLLSRKPEKHYFEVPFPVAIYDALASEQTQRL